jgi:hypothetical protein
MLSGRVLPAHPHPLPDELLTSWFARLAYGQGLKLQTLGRLLFGSARQLWNRDIDRLSPAWLVKALAEQTGTPIERVRETTLSAYEGILFPHLGSSGVLRWVLNVGMYHRTRTKFGLQICPACLRGDSIPYFRRAWRLAFVVCCPRHHCRLVDACQSCGRPLAFHRAELGHPSLRVPESITLCGRCGKDVREAACLPEPHDSLIDLATIAAGLHHLQREFREQICQTLAVLHQFQHLLLTPRYSHRLLLRLAPRSSRSILEPSTKVRRRCIETERIEIRAEILRHAYLLLEQPERWRDLVSDGVVHYSHLLRDFRDLPADYIAWVASLPHRNLPHFSSVRA